MLCKEEFVPRKNHILMSRRIKRQVFSNDIISPTNQFKPAADLKVSFIS